MQAELMGTFGPRLKRLLDEVGITQNELERRAKLSKGAVSNYISERREQPRRDTMQKMAEALGVPLSRLAGDEPAEHESSEVETQGQRQADEYPDREDVIIVLRYLDDRVKQMLRNHRGEKYKAYRFKDWYERALELQEQVQQIDKDWKDRFGEPPPQRPAAEKQRKPGTLVLRDRGRGMHEHEAPISHELYTVLPGTKYLVVRELGRGGMGTVYEAIDLRMRERCAVKVLSSRVADLPEFEGRLLREAEALGEVQSANIIRMREFGRLTNGRPFYAMDLLEGETLRGLLRRGPVAPPIACGLVYQLLVALEQVHRAGIVHRDVKPENLFLRSADGACVLLDFGSVKVLTESERFSPAVVTGPSKALGTARYLPPEVVLGRTPDGRADIYAAGIVLVELLAGELPLGQLDDVAYLSWIGSSGFPVPPVNPATLAPVIARATASDPAERYTSAEAFGEALGWACQRAGIDLLGGRAAPRGAAQRLARDGIFLALGVFASASGMVLSPWRAPPPALVLRPEPALPALAAAAPATQQTEASESQAKPAPSASSPKEAPAPRPAPRDDSDAVKRAQLEMKLKSGRGNLADAVQLENMCQKASDEACLRRAKAFIDAFWSGR